MSAWRAAKRDFGWCSRPGIRTAKAKHRAHKGNAADRYNRPQRGRFGYVAESFSMAASRMQMAIPSEASRTSCNGGKVGARRSVRSWGSRP